MRPPGAASRSLASTPDVTCEAQDDYASLLPHDGAEMRRVMRQCDYFSRSMQIFEPNITLAFSA